MELLKNLILSTAWEMEKPPAYGAFHLTFTLVGFALCIFLAWRLRNLGEKGARRLLFGVGAFLIVIERRPPSRENLIAFSIRLYST